MHPLHRAGKQPVAIDHVNTALAVGAMYIAELDAALALNRKMTSDESTALLSQYGTITEKSRALVATRNPVHEEPSRFDVRDFAILDKALNQKPKLFWITWRRLYRIANQEALVAARAYAQRGQWVRSGHVRIVVMANLCEMAGIGAASFFVGSLNVEAALRRIAAELSVIQMPSNSLAVKVVS